LRGANVGAWVRHNGWRLLVLGFLLVTTVLTWRWVSPSEDGLGFFLLWMLVGGVLSLLALAVLLAVAGLWLPLVGLARLFSFERPER
jgi:hypothetical protein